MLNTARIGLYPLRSSDAPVTFSWINDREQVLFNSVYKPVAEEQHRTWFNAFQRSDAVIFGIRLTENDQLIGTCQLHQIDAVHRSAELQIRLGDVNARSVAHCRR